MAVQSRPQWISKVSEPMPTQRSRSCETCGGDDNKGFVTVHLLAQSYCSSTRRCAHIVEASGDGFFQARGEIGVRVAEGSTTETKAVYQEPVQRIVPCACSTPAIASVIVP